MKQENVGTVVVTDQREIVGILTDRDVALAVAADGVNLDSPVSEVMTRNVLTIWEDQGIFNAAQYFIDHGFRRLPVINHDNELVGMLTTDDLFALLSRELFNVSKALQPALADKVH